MAANLWPTLCSFENLRDLSNIKSIKSLHTSGINAIIVEGYVQLRYDGCNLFTFVINFMFS